MAITKATASTKIKKKFAYHGAGYEVTLRDVPMIRIDGEWVLNINPNNVDRLIFNDLPHSESRLTGNQVRFIREFSDMTYVAFAERFGVSHPAVKKWENAEDQPTNMAWSTEKDIRLFVLSQSNPDGDTFQKCYVDLAKEPTAPYTPIHIDIPTMAIA